jgi:hypothetical protein
MALVEKLSKKGASKSPTLYVGRYAMAKMGREVPFRAREAALQTSPRPYRTVFPRASVNKIRRVLCRRIHRGFIAVL